MSSGISNSNTTNTNANANANTTLSHANPNTTGSLHATANVSVMNSNSSNASFAFQDLNSYPQTSASYAMMKMGNSAGNANGMMGGMQRGQMYPTHGYDTNIPLSQPNHLQQPHQPYQPSHSHHQRNGSLNSTPQFFAQAHGMVLAPTNLSSSSTSSSILNSYASINPTHANYGHGMTRTMNPSESHLPIRAYDTTLASGCDRDDIVSVANSDYATKTDGHPSGNTPLLNANPSIPNATTIATNSIHANHISTTNSLANFTTVTGNTITAVTSPQTTTAGMGRDAATYGRSTNDVVTQTDVLTRYPKLQSLKDHFAVVMITAKALMSSSVAFSTLLSEGCPLCVKPFVTPNPNQTHQRHASWGCGHATHDNIAGPDATTDANTATTTSTTPTATTTDASNSPTAPADGSYILLRCLTLGCIHVAHFECALAAAEAYTSTSKSLEIQSVPETEEVDEGKDDKAATTTAPEDTNVSRIPQLLSSHVATLARVVPMSSTCHFSSHPVDSFDDALLRPLLASHLRENFTVESERVAPLDATKTISTLSLDVQCTHIVSTGQLARLEWGAPTAQPITVGHDKTKTSSELVFSTLPLIADTKSETPLCQRVSVTVLPVLRGSFVIALKNPLTKSTMFTHQVAFDLFPYVTTTLHDDIFHIVSMDTVRDVTVTIGIGKACSQALSQGALVPCLTLPSAGLSSPQFTLVVLFVKVKLGPNALSQLEAMHSTSTSTPTSTTTTTTNKSTDLVVSLDSTTFDAFIPMSRSSVNGYGMGVEANSSNRISVAVKDTQQSITLGSTTLLASPTVVSDLVTAREHALGSVRALSESGKAVGDIWSSAVANAASTSSLSSTSMPSSPQAASINVPHQAMQGTRPPSVLRAPSTPLTKPASAAFFAGRTVTTTSQRPPLPPLQQTQGYDVMGLSGEPTDQGLNSSMTSSQRLPIASSARPSRTVSGSSNIASQAAGETYIGMNQEDSDALASSQGQSVYGHMGSDKNVTFAGQDPFVHTTRMLSGISSNLSSQPASPTLGNEDETSSNHTNGSTSTHLSSMYQSSQLYQNPQLAHAQKQQNAYRQMPSAQQQSIMSQPLGQSSQPMYGSQQQTSSLRSQSDFAWSNPELAWNTGIGSNSFSMSSNSNLAPGITTNPMAKPQLSSVPRSTSESLSSGDADASSEHKFKHNDAMPHGLSVVVPPIGSLQMSGAPSSPLVPFEKISQLPDSTARLRTFANQLPSVLKAFANDASADGILGPALTAPMIDVLALYNALCELPREELTLAAVSPKTIEAMSALHSKTLPPGTASILEPRLPSGHRRTLTPRRAASLHDAEIFPVQAVPSMPPPGTGGDGTSSGSSSTSSPTGANSQNDEPQLMLSVEQVRGQVWRLAKKHSGSRFIQQMLDMRNAGAADYFPVFFKEIRDHISGLMSDHFGHFAVERLVSVCDDNQCLELLYALGPHLVQVSCQKHGSFAVQALLARLRTPEQIAVLVACVAPEAQRLIRHTSGHYVILRMVQLLSPVALEFLERAMLAQCYEICTDHQGLRVAKALLATREPEENIPFLSKLATETLRLVEHQYGNYAVQAALEVAPANLFGDIAMHMHRRFSRLSKLKFSSNVVEAALRCATPAWRDLIIDELFAPDALADLLKDRYGNYVLQTALRLASLKKVLAIRDVIMPNLARLRDNVRTKWANLLNEAISKYNSGGLDAHAALAQYQISPYSSLPSQQQQQQGTQQQQQQGHSAIHNAQTQTQSVYAMSQAHPLQTQGLMSVGSQSINAPHSGHAFPSTKAPIQMYIGPTAGKYYVSQQQQQQQQQSQHNLVPSQRLSQGQGFGQQFTNATHSQWSDQDQQQQHLLQSQQQQHALARQQSQHHIGTTNASSQIASGGMLNSNIPTHPGQMNAASGLAVAPDNADPSGLGRMQFGTMSSDASSNGLSGLAGSMSSHMGHLDMSINSMNLGLGSLGDVAMDGNDGMNRMLLASSLGSDLFNNMSSASTNLGNSNTSVMSLTSGHNASALASAKMPFAEEKAGMFYRDESLPQDTISGVKHGSATTFVQQY